MSALGVMSRNRSRERADPAPVPTVADLQWSKWLEARDTETIRDGETITALGSALVNVLGHHQDHGGAGIPEHLLDLRGVEEPESDIQALAEAAAVVIADIPCMHDCSQPKVLVRM